LIWAGILLFPIGRREISRNVYAETSAVKLWCRNFGQVRNIVLVRITKLPDRGELDEFDLRRFQVGDSYEVTAQMGMLLIVAGCAEIGHTFNRSEAADSQRSRRPSARRR
jgi:hypothetical protein